MRKHAQGTFTVKMTPKNWIDSSDPASEPTLARFMLDKTFAGDLEAVSAGQMLTAGAVEKGSAGYVAVERVTGVLDGHQGTFALLHTGVMNRGTPSLSITIVPDSGTDELEGIAGTLEITIADGKHFYDLIYSLPTK